MASLSSLRNELTKYYYLYNNCSTILSYLAQASSKVNDANRVGSFYSINDVSADNNLVFKEKEKLEDIASDLRYSIIPWIERKIASLKNEIRIAESQQG